MKRFEYDITKHSADDFERLTFFCSSEGECSYEELPSSQMKVLNELLNKKGEQGWELIQLFFGKEGVLAFWKRAI